MKPTKDQIIYLKKRYHLARRRALYWSGNPSFDVRSRTQNTSSSERSLPYELARCDIKNLAADLHRLGVAVDADYDPRAAFHKRRFALMSKLSPPAPPHTDPDPPA